jgi:hypothetical protein
VLAEHHMSIRFRSQRNHGMGSYPIPCA